jgi:hypothetical protein
MDIAACDEGSGASLRPVEGREPSLQDSHAFLAALTPDLLVALAAAPL